MYDMSIHPIACLVNRVYGPLCVQFGFYRYFFTGYRMDKFNFFRTEPLGKDAHFATDCLGLGGAVLGIAQNGKAHMGTMQTQLVGSAGDRTQFQFT